VYVTARYYASTMILQAKRKWREATLTAEATRAWVRGDQHSCDASVVAVCVSLGVGWSGFCLDVVQYY